MPKFKNISSLGELDVPLLNRIIGAGEEVEVTEEQAEQLALQPDTWQGFDADGQPIIPAPAPVEAETEPQRNAVIDPSWRGPSSDATAVTYLPDAPAAPEAPATPDAPTAPPETPAAPEQPGEPTEPSVPAEPDPADPEQTPTPEEQTDEPTEPEVAEATAPKTTARKANK